MRSSRSMNSSRALKLRSASSFKIGMEKRHSVRTNLPIALMSAPFLTCYFAYLSEEEYSLNRRCGCNREFSGPCRILIRRMPLLRFLMGLQLWNDLLFAFRIVISSSQFGHRNFTLISASQNSSGAAPKLPIISPPMKLFCQSFIKRFAPYSP